MRHHNYHRLAAAVLLLAVFAGCRGGAKPAAAQASSRTEELASGRIEVSLTATPDVVSIDKPLFITFTLSAPESMTVQLPALDDRFDGFQVAGSYEAGVRTERGRTLRDIRVRLTPLAAPEYRLKPMAVTYRDSRMPTEPEGWIKTRPIVFAAVPLPKASGLQTPAPPVNVPPTAREIGLGLLILAAAASAVALTIYLARRAIRAHKLRQMSPRERALLELETLIGRRLVEQGQIKEFYFELTFVVRRYIERRHRVRAPEQTTEEFLASAASNPEFPPDTLLKLQAFLKAADLVKYAAYQPDRESIPRALDAARDYVSTDSPEPAKEGA